MIDRKELRKLAAERLKDAEALAKARRYDGALYVCGYVVELALKARICRTLKWAGFPETNREFDGVKSLKTHDFDSLLRFSGREAKVKTTHFADWSVATSWKPELRYRTPGTATKTEAEDIISASEKLYKVLA